MQEIGLDVNKVINKLAIQISQLSIQNAALQSQVEAYEEVIRAQNNSPVVSAEPVSKPDIGSQD